MLRKKAQPVSASAAGCSVQAALSPSAKLSAGDTASDVSDVGGWPGEGHERARRGDGEEEDYGYGKRLSGADGER
jgi:hypothetical protein